MKDVFADIIVDITHEAVDRTFQYKVPPDLQESVVPGTRVSIPFGPSDRLIGGYVIAIADHPDFDPDRIKEIREIIPGSLPVEARLIKVADFMRIRYGSTMIQALKTVLPVKQKIRQRTKIMVGLAIPVSAAEEILAEYERKHYTARARLLRKLIEKESLDLALLKRESGLPKKEFMKLRDQGILKMDGSIALRRITMGDEEEGGSRGETFSWGGSCVLNPDQQRIADAFKKDYEEGIRKTYLLFGVTGSGKTEVYLNLIETVLGRGKRVIVLIPEISLTYQTVRRFEARFGSSIAVLHSRLSRGERFDETERIRNGEARVVIGARSALFAPVNDLGLIIIDEEHDGAYKSDTSPKYHARETAVYLAGLAGASLVLGSATPSVESYAKAMSGDYGLFCLPGRAGHGKLPHTLVADMREEFAAGNRSMFSRPLRDLMEDRLLKKEQIILFLNRRGYAGFVSCRSCGQVIKCPHCDVSLTYHREGMLRCHYCGYETGYSKLCPVCGLPYVAAFGLGIQKVESALYAEFPGVRVLRMDADTTRKKHGHETILKTFASGQADILLGTQMIVKGHDYPAVTLVGILAADMSLNDSDYRSGEKTFQLLCQAAGRAGRGEKAGEVVIQTYSPDHYAIKAAVDQSYTDFFEQEYIYRKMMGYPPFAHLLVILIQSSVEEQAIRAAWRIQRIILQSQNTKEKTPVILNPGKAAVSRIKDVYRQVLYLKHKDEEVLWDIRQRLEPVIMKHPLFAGVFVQFDYDPMNRY